MHIAALGPGPLADSVEHSVNALHASPLLQNGRTVAALR